jgi:hypothetical protein
VLPVGATPAASFVGALLREQPDVERATARSEAMKKFDFFMSMHLPSASRWSTPTQNVLSTAT